MERETEADTKMEAAWYQIEIEARQSELQQGGKAAEEAEWKLSLLYNIIVLI